MRLHSWQSGPKSRRGSPAGIARCRSIRSIQYRRKASAPAASLVRASSGTGKSAGPPSGSTSVVSAALGDGSVSLASCFSEQPASSTVPITAPTTVRRSCPDPRRSTTAGDYAGRGAGGFRNCGQLAAAAGSGERPRMRDVAHRRTIRSRGDDATGRGRMGTESREYPFDTSGIEVGADGIRRYTDLPVNLVQLLRAQAATLGDRPAVV